MSNDQLIFQPNTTPLPNVIIDFWMPRLTDTQFKCLMVITRKTLGWHKRKDQISIKQICELTGFKDRAVQYAIRDLIEHKLVVKTENKFNSKNPDANTYELNILELVNNNSHSKNNKKTNNNKEKEEKDNKKGVVHADAPPPLVHVDAPGVVHPGAPTKETEINLCFLKDRDNSDNRDLEEVAISDIAAVSAFHHCPLFQKDWSSKLTSEEKKFHDALLQYIPPVGEKLESSFITAQLKKHGLQKMKDAFNFCLYTIQKTGIKKSLGALFRTALDKELKAPNEDFEKNKKLAIAATAYSKEFNVTEKYITLPTMSWDLQFSLSHQVFGNELKKKLIYLGAIRS